MTLKTYISGPMTGLPGLNFPAFHAAAAALRAVGLEVVNPAELNDDPQADWQRCMRIDIKALCDCEALVLLPGWENSRGAHLELHVAHCLGLAVATLETAVRWRPTPAQAVRHGERAAVAGKVVGSNAGLGVTREHELKVWGSFFDALMVGTKTFEVRRDDRGFKPGDYLRLREWVEGEYTGRELTKRVTYILQGGAFGLEAGHVVLSLADA